jgi:shikimate kinase
MSGPENTSGPENQPIVLVGLMGSGKTSVGTRLAAVLGRNYRDSDDELEERYGQTAAEQAERYGAEVLHEREAALLREAVAERPPVVAAAAASIADDEGCRAILTGAGAYVIWLDAPPHVLVRRIGSHDHRPHFHSDPAVMLAAHYAQRAPRFRELADLTVDVSVINPDEATAAIVAALERVER